MPKEKWGVKRICPSCSIRFYDLLKDPMTCPSCAHEFSLESVTGNKSRTMQSDKPDAQNKEAEKVTADEDVILDDDDDDDEVVVEGDGKDGGDKVDDADAASLGAAILDDDDDDDDDTVSLDELADVDDNDDDDDDS